MGKAKSGRILVLLIIILIITVLNFQFRRSGPVPETIGINELAEDIKSRQVIRMLIDDGEVEVIYWDGSSAFTRFNPEKDIIDQLNDFGVPSADLSPDLVEVEYVKVGSSTLNIFIGGAIGGLIGILVGASLMRLYHEFRPRNSN